MIRANSSIATEGIRLATPLALLTGTYLLFAGHNQPGGGFAAGLVFGCVLALRKIVGIQKSTHAAKLVAIGVLIVAAVSLAPILFGDPLLDQKVISFDIPALGKVKSGSALPFDIGVTLIVVGVVGSFLEGLSDHGNEQPEGNLL